MYSLFNDWYKRKFSDPNAVTLMIILISVFVFIYLFSDLLMPVFVAVALAFLLDLPVNKLKQLGLSRLASVMIILSLFIGIGLITFLGLLPIIWKQSANLLQEVPHMISEGKIYLMTLPEKYPDFIQVKHIEHVLNAVNEKLLVWGELALQASLNSISDVVALLIYLILVPLMVFFFLKDKKELRGTFSDFFPKDRRMVIEVGNEMHQQIMNYIRGKLIEILIIGTASTVAFIILGLHYPVLLGVLVGLSVLVPYVGATIVTLPVMLVGLSQWGFTAEFGYLMTVYAIIQALDGNLLVPILFSEAVNLHPVTIIISVIFFGGLWGFWGVFFAIPLATLVKAVLNAWSTTKQELQLE